MNLMAARLSIFHKGLILILSPIVLETVIVLALNAILLQIDQEQHAQSKFKDMSTSVIKMSSLSFEAGMLLFVMGMPGSKVPSYMFGDKISELRNQTRMVNNNAQKDPVMKKLFVDIVVVEEKCIDLLEALGDTVRSGSQTSIVSQLQDTISKITSMLNQTAGLVDKVVEYNSARIEQSRKVIEELRHRYSIILIMALLSNVCLAGTLMLYFDRSIIQRLLRIRSNTDLLRAGKDLPAALPGRDEISLLDLSFHAMQEALKATRRKEELFFENAADVICVLDRHDHFVKLNPATLLNWGLEPEALLGKNLASIVHKDDLELLESQLETCRDEWKPVSFECRIMRQRTTAVEFTWSVYLEPVEEQLFCIAHDISEQKELERARERYVAIIGNDLRQPIVSISNSFSDVLSTFALPEKASAKINTVIENLKRLLTLVNELSVHHSFEEAEELKVELINSERLIKQAVSDIEGVARTKEISISCQVRESEFEGDFDRLMQVLVNLLSNAVKFSPAKSELGVFVTQYGQFLEFSVEDHGRGIPENKIADVFEKFKQVDLADGMRSQGTGLGLPICKQIVEAHGGSIGLSSKENEGSRFWFRLPKVQNRKTTDLPASIATPPNSAASTFSAGVAADPSGGLLSSESAASGRRMAAPLLLANLPLVKKGALLIGVPLLFEFVIVGTLTLLFLQSEALARTELAERKIVETANEITFCYRRMSIAILSPDSDNMYPVFVQNMKESGVLCNSLKELVKKDPERSKRFQVISKQIRTLNANLSRSYGMRSQAQSSQLLTIGITLRMLRPMGVLTHQLQDLVLESSGKEALSPARQKELRKLQGNLMFGGLLVNVLIGLALARMFSNDIKKRMESIAENTRLLAREEKLQAQVEGTDELAVLDAAFHMAAAELSDARKRERTLFDNSKEVICIFDQSSKMTAVNPAATRIWGYSRTELMNREFLDFVHEEDRALTVKNLFGTTGEDGSARTFENRVVADNGRICNVLWSVTRAGGEVFCMAQDITGRKETERLRNEFLSIVSHDLRTPLSGILVTATMLEEGGYGELPEAAVARLATVSTDVNRLLELINDLLDIEKIDAGMMTFSYEPSLLCELFEEVEIKAHKLIASKACSLNLIKSEIELSLDRGRFIQALLNLLQNAVERSEKDSSVDISASSNSEICTIVVRDHAAPLDDQACLNIFDRYAIAGKDSELACFSNLAVPLSRSIIKAHGGTVSLHSNLDGNEFEIRLPLQANQAFRAFASSS